MSYGKYSFIDEDEVLRLLPKIEKFTGELPWVLFDYINVPAYLGSVSPEVVQGFYDRRHDLSIVENPLEYLKYDLKVWVEDNPEFKSIYIGG